MIPTIQHPGKDITMETEKAKTETTTTNNSVVFRDEGGERNEYMEHKEIFRK